MNIQEALSYRVDLTHNTMEVADVVQTLQAEVRRLKSRPLVAQDSMDSICSECGQRYGKHRLSDSACPVTFHGKVAATIHWTQTTFKESHS